MNRDRWKRVERNVAAEKRCPRCRQIKSLSSFHGDKSRKDGRRIYCKECAAAMKANWYVAHPRPQRTHKTCERCGQSKQLSEFATNGRSKLSSCCKSCTRPYHPSNLKDWSDRRRNQQYKFKHGITLDQYNEMLERQSHRCAICAKHESELTSILVIDHNHRTGKIRGLLCGNCNRGIGYMQDDPEILAKARIYLEERS